MLNSPMKFGDKIVSEEVIEAGLAEMRRTPTFDNMDVASALGRAGFEPHDLWLRQDVANRLLQKARKAGLIEFKKKQWHVVP